MTDLRKAAEMAFGVPLHEQLESVPEDARLVIEDSDGYGTRFIPVGRMCKEAVVALRQALAQPEQEYVIDCPRCGHCCPNVDAINMSQERVDETAKREHEPWPSLQCTCGATIYFKYTPPVSDYHEGWEEGFKAAKREWVGLTEYQRLKFADRFHISDAAVEAIEAKLKEKNA